MIKDLFSYRFPGGEPHRKGESPTCEQQIFRQSGQVEAQVSVIGSQAQIDLVDDPLRRRVHNKQDMSRQTSEEHRTWLR